MMKWTPENLFNRSRWSSKIRYRVDDGDRAVVNGQGTLVLPMMREHLLRYLPNNSRVAEIGVARGHFSAQLRRTCRPSFLALVDPWREQNTQVYYADANNAEQREQDRRFAKVSRRFASSKPRKVCRVIRKFSAEAVEEFDDKSLDWVFIDGNHSYEACLEDLRLWSPKVVDDGFICGHDFAEHASARSSKFGVVGAVKTFVNETGFALAALTIEHFPTFVIAKKPGGGAHSRMRQLLFSYEPHLIQIPDCINARFEHARILDNGVPRSGLMSFKH